MIKMVKDSKNNPIQIRQLTHNKVLKMFSIYFYLKKRQEKKKRKFWVRPIFKQDRRLLQGASDNLVVEMQLDHFYYLSYITDRQYNRFYLK